MVTEIVRLLSAQKIKIACMESCTGGSLVNAITDVEGSSDVLELSLVTYSSDAKIKMGVSKETIDQYSVYSKETADEMSKVVTDLANADIGIGITGILSDNDPNNSGNPHKVFISIYMKKDNKYINDEINVNKNNRHDNKQLVIDAVLMHMLKVLSK